MTLKHFVKRYSYFVSVLIYSAMHEPTFSQFNLFGKNRIVVNREGTGIFSAMPVDWEIEYICRNDENGSLNLFM
jgi:hypothetical protein